MTSSTSLSRAPIWFAALVIFALLGFRGLNEPDEARVAGIAREMLASGDWMVPRLYDHAHFNKPPLLYWIMIPFLKLGGINEWMARLPAALAALGTILLTRSLAARHLGPERANAAALILLTCPLFAAMSQIVDYNMVLTFWVTLSLWAWDAWRRDGRKRDRLIFYVGLGLAFMTKGPVGPVIVGLTLLGHRIARPSANRERPIWSVSGVVLFLLIALPWFIASALRYPELWSFFLRGEVVDRVFTDAHHREEPIYFYLAVLPASILPWIAPVWRAVRDAIAQRFTAPLSRLALGWIVLPLVLFTVSASKMPTYILPLMPACALLAASAIRLRPAAVWTYAIAMAAFFQVAHAFAWRVETQLDAKSTVRSLCETLRREAKPGDRVALLERHPRGLSFYWPGPVSVPFSKFQVQIRADEARLADKDFDNPARMFNEFDGTDRVFFVCSERVAQERARDARHHPRELYRDSDRLLISNR